MGKKMEEADSATPESSDSIPEHRRLPQALPGCRSAAEEETSESATNVSSSQEIPPKQIQMQKSE